MSLAKRSIIRHPSKSNQSEQKTSQPTASKKAGFVSFKSFSKTNKQSFSKYDQLYIFEGMSLIIDQKLTAAKLYFKDMAPHLAPLFKQSLLTALSSPQYSRQQQIDCLLFSLDLLPNDSKLLTLLSKRYKDMAIEESNLNQTLNYLQKAYNCLPKGPHSDKATLVMEMTNTCFSLGRSHYQEKDYKKAAFYFQTAQKLCPKTQKLLHHTLAQWIKKLTDIQNTLTIGKRFKTRFFPQKTIQKPSSVRKKGHEKTN